MSCLTNLYPVTGGSYIGSDGSGKPVEFKGIPEYQEYLKKLSEAGHTCPDMSQANTVPAVLKTEVTPFTGFLEFQPANPREQAMYSAMSRYWVGSDATNIAFNAGLNKSLSR
jgi:hypothetical protein